jgi:hypothetical protein
MNESPVQRIRQLKTEAKNRRDRGLKGYPRAVELLREAIELGKPCLAESTIGEFRAQVAAELADCHGLLGGIERRWALDGPSEHREDHLLASISAYDEGFKLEDDEQYGIVNSYNRVNRLMVRLLLRPELLDSDGAVNVGGGTTPLDVRKELVTTASTIAEQLAGPRRGDYWAMADLAMTQVMLGQVDPVTAYAKLNAASPADYVYTSALTGLRPLAELPLRTSPALRDAVRLLEKELQRLRG